MIDSNGFRANVGIVLSNSHGQVFWGKRSGMDAWQFPQGGIKEKETPKSAMYRELKEETGLEPEHVEFIGATDDWLRYWLPKKFIRHHVQPTCIGQKQIWYLLKLVVDESHVNLDVSHKPEFDFWKWIDVWDSMNEVIFFKRDVYKQALKQLEPLILNIKQDSDLNH